MRRWRRLNKLWADLLGYFWIPCPACGTWFGGHEVGGTRYTRPDWHTGQLVCWRCGDCCAVKPAVWFERMRLARAERLAFEKAWLRG